MTPSENMVWADVDGHIGWQAVGLAPRRKNWDGLMPVPGDGRYEWDGYLPILDLPHVTDPPRGWFATANQDNLPPGYPFAVGFQWTDPFRFSRIEEVLGSGRRFSMMDMMQLQQDEVSLPARSLVPLLRGLKPGQRATAPGDRSALVVGLRPEPGLGARRDLCHLGACTSKPRSGNSSCPRKPGPYFRRVRYRPRS